MRFVRNVSVLLLSVLLIANTAFAENKPEETIPLKPQNEDGVDLTQLRRAKLSEEQVVNQLKYMMVSGFTKVEKQLVEKGSFEPFGLTLMPDGEFKSVFTDTGDVELLPSIVLATVAKNMEAMAQTRSVWAVGIMYIRAVKRADGSYAQRIIVMTEHIAGWARHWAYPFKVENGEVKLAQPTETAVEPIYFVEKKKRR